MSGDIDELTDITLTLNHEYNCTFHLKFWFNRHVGLALPLIALQYHEVRFNFEFNDASKLIVANDAF